MLGCLGGWIGAICGQQIHRHKTSKLQFQLNFFFYTVTNIIFIYLSHGDILTLPSLESYFNNK